MKKKNLTKALAFAMAFALTAVSPLSGAVSVKAADETTTSSSATTITVDYEKFTATIATTNEKAKYVILEVVKDKDASKVTATYVYPVTSKKATVDLSFLKATKAAYIRAYDDINTTPCAVVEVAAQPAKLKVKFVAGQTDLYKAFTISSGKDAVTLTKDAELAKYSYRSMYAAQSASNTLDKWDMATAVVAGTTLLIHEKAVAGTAPAGAEVKVKVAAAAKAPKVTVDYVKGTIALKKGMEVKILYDGTEQAAWTTITEANAGKLSIEDLFKTCEYTDTDNKAVKNGFTILVRTAKTDKKAASNIAFVKIDAQTAIAKTDDKSELKAGAGVLTWENKENGISFTATTASFDYYNPDSEKWVTIKPGKAVLVKNERTADTTYKIRLSGVKANAKNGVEAAFPSAEYSLTLAKRAKANTPTVSSGTVTSGDKSVAVKRESATSSKITLTTSATVFEYSTDNKTWTALTASGATIDDAAAVTVYVRVAATVDALASDAASVSIAAATEASN